MAGYGPGKGEERFHGRMASEYRILRKVLERFEGGKIRVAYEAGPSGFGLLDQLRGDGVEGIVVPPSLIPIESGTKVKTDKRGSRKLARLMESNMLKRVHVLTPEDRSDRELLRGGSGVHEKDSKYSFFSAAELQQKEKEL